MSLISTQEVALLSIDKLARSNLLAIDFETSSVNPVSCKVFLMSLYNGELSFVFDLTKIDLRLFKNLLETKVLIAQNAAYELVILTRYGIHPNIIHDTYLAECILTQGTQEKRNLGVLAEKYLNITLDKQVAKTITSKNYTSQKVVEYSRNDVIVLPTILKKQFTLLKKGDLYKTYLFELQYLKVIAETSYHGIRLDPKAWAELNTQLRINRDQALQELNDLILEIDPELANNSLFGFELNWNSPSQVKELFNRYVDSKITSVGEKKLNAYKGHPLVQKFLKYVSLSKRVSSFGDTYLEAIDKTTQRIHPSYTQIVATGRVSCRRPNIQNIPKQDMFRKCFIADPSNTLVVGDYSSQESRILADKSQSPELISFFTSGGQDLHSFVALKAFANEIGDIPIEEVKGKYPKLRDKAKAANFALTYGGDGRTVARNLNLPEEEGLAVEKAFFEAFPSIKEYFTSTKETSIRKGFIVTDNVIYRKIFSNNFVKSFKPINSMTKEERILYFKSKSEFERLAMNYPIQGTAASMTKLAGIYLRQANLERNLFRIVLFVHDEILLECAKEHALEVQGILKECMERAANVFCRSVSIPVEPMITEYWTH